MQAYDKRLRLREDDILPTNRTGSWYIPMRVNHPQSMTLLALTVRDWFHRHLTTSKLGFQQVIKVECNRIDSASAITFAMSPAMAASIVFFAGSR